MADNQEPWIKWVALSTTILAVFAAFAALKGGGYSTKTQLLTTRETNQWSYYQAKSIKAHLAELQKESLEIMKANNPTPQAAAKIDALILANSEAAARYNKEKEEIRKKAEELSAEQEDQKRHGGNFGMAVMFLQISIMMSAIGSLLKQKPAWLAGLCVGAIGVIFFLNGFYLFF